MSGITQVQSFLLCYNRDSLHCADGSYNTRGLYANVVVTTRVAFMQWWQLQYTWPLCSGGSYNTRGLHAMVAVTIHVAFTQMW